MKSAAAKCAIEHGRFAEAQALLEDVDLDASVEHPTLDVRGIAKSNHAVVVNLLKNAVDAGRPISTVKLSTELPTRL